MLQLLQKVLLNVMYEINHPMYAHNHSIYSNDVNL